MDRSPLGGVLAYGRRHRDTDLSKMPDPCTQFFSLSTSPPLQ